MWDAYDFGISLESTTWGPDNVTISDCIIKADTMTYGIFSATPGMKNLSINNVTIKSSDPDHYAINMQHDTASIISNCLILGTKYGITLTSSIGATVFNNNITGGASQGVQLGGDADKNIIMNNYISKTAGYPVYINSGATSNVIANNVLGATWFGGVILDLGTNTVQFNNYSILDGSKMPDKVANNIDYLYVATSDGLTTGLIGSGSQNITVTSASANYILCLPSTSAVNIGQVITGQVGANGFELRPIVAQAATVYINNVTTNVEAAIPANSVFEIRCVDATHWILKAWTMLGAELTAIIPDAV
jgi:parallel beta-helix repeat protein